ncbi:MAG TPA: ATP-binding protein [Gemmatimonadales bacterium]|nr:ATP-binding protein [Gemmatimonadales bacterium]
MDTIRTRLTSWFASAVAIILAGFTVAVFLSRRSALYGELDRRIESEAELTAGILAGVARAGGTVVRTDAAGRPVLAQELSATLEAVPDFLLITASEKDSFPLFVSVDSGGLTYPKYEQLRNVIVSAQGRRVEGTIRLVPDGQRLRYIVRPLGPEVAQGGAVLVGVRPETAELGLEQTFSTFLLILPFGVLAAYAIGSLVARRALRPVDQITNEVREITDGTGLHRRLPTSMVKDELGRLADTLNQMISRLERSFTALRRFTADASHELKTPLTVLKAGVERALTTPKMPPDSLAALEEAMDEINRMTELVDALLTLARADEGLVRLHQEPVDLRALILETEETGELLAEPAGIAVSADAPVDPVIVPVDGSRIRQLVMNLLTNAVKYTPAGGRVRLWLEQDDGRVRFGVSDTGIGIAPGDLPHIFDRFWRADSARTRTGERPGVGLGLAICKWIAEAHGGTIEVQSRPGRGTTFSVTLPMGSPETASPQAPTPAGP